MTAPPKFAWHFVGQRGGRVFAARAPSDPVRHHWLPLKPALLRFKTVRQASRSAIRASYVSGRDLGGLRPHIVERRLIEAGMRGQRRLPLVAAQDAARRLSDLAVPERCDRSRQSAGFGPRVHGDQVGSLGVRIRSPAPPHSSKQPEEAWLCPCLACLPWPLAKSQNIPAERALVAGDSSRATVPEQPPSLWHDFAPPESARRCRAGVTDAATARLMGRCPRFPIHHGVPALRARHPRPCNERTDPCLI